MDRETLQALQSFKEELEDRLLKIRPLVETLPVRAMEFEPDSVHDAFRQLHSLKGAANLLGLTPIGQLAHKLEDILARVRQSEIVFDEKTRSVLLAGLDRIEDLGADLRKVRLVDVSRELAQIDAIMDRR
jgi:two-component system chemotaxis sensor kinase CheA